MRRDQRTYRPYNKGKQSNWQTENIIENLHIMSKYCYRSLRRWKKTSNGPLECYCYRAMNRTMVKVKASNTRYRALGPVLIPVYRQSARSHPPGGRLPLLSARPTVTFPAAEHHCPLAGTKLYCLVTEAYTCEQFAQGCYAALLRVAFERTTC